ncbi:helix-turn-helix domain-containing protein [Actinospica durhamensis]|uniref:Helix-turn-helix domain-containing protein n=1 Tax=Actinospica durhamensis TaxID=1508375 RepID=A0A941EQX0_9ACTN|nr:helix-turn-helix transcriptional regulator [Actinospica durhamensis]MBR7834858.1 helix-turn-helix domain-containing protein [Actinospica durhamensis]
MDQRREFSDFLASRRAKLTPEQAGLPMYGGNRRVAGLRREEVALMAGVSVDYYVKLERGNARGVSESVLEALARALQLDEAERAHLFDLAHSLNSAGRPPRRAPKPQVRPSVQRILDSMATTPAYARNRRLDILATNRLGRALVAPVFADPRRPASLARFMFLDPAAVEYYRDWEPMASDIVAALRSEAGRDPHDKALQDLVGELSTRSELFRTRWAAHNVRLHRTGVKHLHHPVVGELTLDFDAMELPADPGLAIIAYSAEPASPSAEKLRLLASWAATLDQEDEPSQDHTASA